MYCVNHTVTSRKSHCCFRDPSVKEGCKQVFYETILGVHLSDALFNYGYQYFKNNWQILERNCRSNVSLYSITFSPSNILSIIRVTCRSCEWKVKYEQICFYGNNSIRNMGPTNFTKIFSSALDVR